MPQLARSKEGRRRGRVLGFARRSTARSKLRNAQTQSQVIHFIEATLNDFHGFGQMRVRTGRLFDLATSRDRRSQTTPIEGSHITCFCPPSSSEFLPTNPQKCPRQWFCSLACHDKMAEPFDLFHAMRGWRKNADLVVFLCWFSFLFVFF